MSDEPSDKRRRRSEETQQAITYQLEHLVEEFDDIELMLLADDHGLMIARAGDEEACEMLAVQARPLAEGKSPDSELLVVMPDLRREQLLCEAINLDDIPLYLCAVMEPTAENAKAFERARTGIQRIYYSTSELGGDSQSDS